MTDNIKLPKHSKHDFGYEFDSGIAPQVEEYAEAYAREAVRLNATVPDGWKLVPVQATPDMCKAAVIYANGNAVYKNVAHEALEIEESIYSEVYDAMLSAAPAAPQPAQPAQPLTVPDAQEKDLLQAIQERDAADDYIDALLDEVLGTDRPEWSSVYGHADAIEQVREMMNTLMKPSIDKAWDRFQSSVAPAAPQPAQSLDDESDALTVAYLHGHGKGKDSVQPLLAEKDALLRQALEALEGFANITNDSQGVKGYHLNGDIAEWDEFDEVDAASNTIEAIRKHLGVKP